MTGSELSRVLCEVCDENGKQQAIYRCQECDNFLCAVCKAAHLSFKVLRHHKIVDLRELLGLSDRAGVALDQPGMKLASLQGDRCEKHPGEVLQFFCQTCQRMICWDCTFVDHPKPEHKCTDLKEAVEHKREELLMLIQSSKQVEAKLNTSLKDLSELGKLIESAAMTAQAEVNRTADHALVISQKRVQGKRERHLQDVVTLRTQRKTTVSDRRDVTQNTLACLRQTQSAAARIVKSGSDQELLASYTPLTASLHQEMTSAEALCGVEIMSDLAKFEFSSYGHNPKQSPLHTVFDTGALGHLRGQWVLQREIGCSDGSSGLRGASSLAVSRWGDLIVAENQRQTVQLFERNGERRFSLTTVENIMKETRVGVDKILGFVRAVAFSRAGHIIICDCSNFVKVFSRQGRYLCAFTTTAPSDNCRGPVWLCCLAVDERNRIYVGDCSRRCVTIHEPNGTRMQLLDCTRPAQLAVAGQYIIVLPADPTDSIKLVDHVGSTKRSLSVPDSLQPWLPASVVCSTENKNIFVVNGHKDGERGIHEFTMEGDYRGCIESNLTQPAGIALSRSQDGEELYVADDTTVKVLRKI
ncbi:uncharacterized protein LOC110978571 [Acanthaster planci]|uniref:Uncharacterized protein LOC110978571 n=1 Tax=Acanthaster planci TaxID=133434 RepID=A0A8B7Y9Y5_ACAPL|nr:uncharacterized protein LOC110978571 [Acanthaster planci]